jgi:hypothetical protein
VLQNAAARFSQRNFAATDAPLDEPHPDEALESRELLAHRRLAVAKLASRRRQRPFFDHRAQSQEMAEFDAEPPKVLAYICHRKQTRPQ